MVKKMKVNSDNLGHLRVFINYVSGGVKKYIAWTSNSKADLYKILVRRYEDDDPLTINVTPDKTYYGLSGLPDDFLLIDVYARLKDVNDEELIGGVTVYPNSDYPELFDSSPKGAYWYESQTDDVKENLNECQFYENYLNTTINISTNLGPIFEENKIKTNKLYFRTNNRILFHGDEENRPPYLAGDELNERMDMIFGGGGTPPEVNGSVLIFPGYFVGALESYTYSLPITFGYDDKNAYGPYLPNAFPENAKFIYVSNAPGGIEVSKSLNQVLDGEGEVAFPGGVRGKWIIGVFIDVPNKGFTDYIINPNSDTEIGKAPTGMVDIIISTMSPDYYYYFDSLDGGESFKFDTPWKRLPQKGKYLLMTCSQDGKAVRSGKLFFNAMTVSDIPQTIIDLETVPVLNGVLVISYILKGLN